MQDPEIVKLTQLQHRNVAKPASAKLTGLGTGLNLTHES